MTEEIYYLQLNALRADIRRGKIKRVLDKLDELFEWKPVRLKWFLVRAEALSALGQWEESNLMLKNRYDFTYEDPEAVSYLNWYKSWRIEERDFLGEKLCCFLQNLLKQQSLEGSSFLDQANSKLHETEIDWLENSLNEDLCYKLLEMYYTQSRFIEYIILKQYIKRNGMECHKEYFFFDVFMRNMWYLKEKVNAYDAQLFHIIIDSEEQVTTAYTMAYILKQLGHKVYLFTEPVICEIERDISIEDTVKITLENEEDMDGISILHPVDIVSFQGKSSNISNILYHFKEESPGHTMILIGASNRLDQIFTNQVLNKCSSLIGGKATYKHGGYYTFGYVGDYLDHLDEIFHIDSRYEILKKPDCRFSIILPVRGSAETLKYTLQTCLNQRFQDYEIIVSDNSEQGYHEVANLIKSLNSFKIKYYKTPRPCTLGKSFEFAYLKSNGEFLLSLGADDAILPWGLEVLDKLLNSFPEEEVFCWDRGFYIWPNFTNQYQLGQFNIPRSYIKNELNVQRWNSIDCLNRILEYPNTVYSEPLMYINSGFRKSFFKTLLDNTGSLWGGNAQDVYMGVATLCIKQSVIHLNYPITIAGMSSSSVGANDSSNNRGSKVTELYDSAANSCILYPYLQEECSAFTIGNEFSTVLRDMLRTKVKGILPDKIKDKLTLPYIIQETVRKEIKTSIYFERNILTMKYLLISSSLDGQLQLEKDLFSDCLKPETFATPADDTLLYRQGFQAGGGIILDSRKFNVKNIVEAVNLFENITNL